ncbi:uncharacterized protein [Euwallacea fornicatus]|uniref:uncharacterized protein isoform X3 n=1 Tax=Euwallacea fornicatus TaxID=995702 RepID=UPI00338DF33C
MAQLIGVVLSVVCAVLMVRGEGHHIDQRILKDQLVIGIDQNSSVPEGQASLAEMSSSEHSFNPVLTTPVNITALLRSDKASRVIGDAENDPINVNYQQDTKNNTDTEIEDLLHRNDVNDEEKYIQNYQHPFEPEIPINYPDKIDKEAERIEDSEKTEDELRRHKDENISDGPHGPLAAVLISMLVAVAALCYAALLIWRRYLENKYGSRTLLVEDEELADPNDMKHFSI